MDRVHIKSISKVQLGGGIFKYPWLNAVVFGLAAGVIISFASMTLVGTIVVLGPIMYAQSKVFLKLARGASNTIELRELFDGFKDDFGGTLLLGLMISIFTSLWSLLFVVPGIVKSYAYSMAYYVKVDHPEYGWQQCIDESKRLTAGHKGELFLLDLSFIGWVLVGSLACGVGLFWVDPYIVTAKTNAYLYLLGQAAAESVQA